MGMIARMRLCLTAEGDQLVPENDPAAAYLYAAIGDEIPNEAAAMFGLEDGRLPGHADEAAIAAAQLAQEEAEATAAAAEQAEREAEAKADAEATAAAAEQAEREAEAKADAEATADAEAKEDAEAVEKAEADIAGDKAAAKPNGRKKAEA